MCVTGRWDIQQHLEHRTVPVLPHNPVATSDFGKLGKVSLFGGFRPVAHRRPWAAARRDPGAASWTTARCSGREYRCPGSASSASATCRFAALRAR
ncbi:hypothetical protein ABH940_003389 [Streptacidiphilus sp. BW17]